ncbi:MAG: lytic transglycosylase domain-containing protein [Candidatus Manganitrophus sp.]|nr:lytic transglycosylase domain-containing protein [Candidatus Manganitrophus sp.]
MEKEAAEQGMEPALIKAVVRAESDFNAFAVSSAGALGLMQLMPATAADLRLSDPFDPEENIRGESGTFDICSAPSTTIWSYRWPRIMRGWGMF